MGVHFNLPLSATVHDHTALMALLTGNSKFEAVDPSEPPLAPGIAKQRQPAERDIPVEQFHIHSFAMLPHRRQSALSDAV